MTSQNLSQPNPIYSSLSIKNIHNLLHQRDGSTRTFLLFMQSTVQVQALTSRSSIPLTVPAKSKLGTKAWMSLRSHTPKYRSQTHKRRSTSWRKDSNVRQNRVVFCVRTGKHDGINSLVAPALKSLTSDRLNFLNPPTPVKLKDIKRFVKHLQKDLKHS
ncbi:hypothetical protein L596_026199 [Steinernema carpocapsae]|uniref:Uncharacterized protein n=1 Tax=Steinernema carpocapsae TaxID=34508 RepID=A0A4U5M0P4_STECR|nr:hypothetical protein L596_026199 [Steinernema carpocapsae]